MFLVEILLPLYDYEGRRFAAEEFDRVRDQLRGALSLSAHLFFQPAPPSVPRRATSYLRGA